MPLTITTALQAGQLAQSADNLQSFVNAATTEVNGGGSLIGMSFTFADGTQINTNTVGIGASATATLMNEIISLANGYISTVTTELGTM